VTLDRPFWIDYPSEPTELLLAWRAPLFVKDRSHWAVGRLRREGDEAAFQYLVGADFAALNHGRSLAELTEAGYAGFPAFGPPSPSEQTVFSAGVLAAFLRRLPSPSRADFPQYLAHHFLRATSTVSAFSLLSVTGARLPSDGFSLVDPLDLASDRIDTILEVVGARHYRDNLHDLTVGDTLELLVESENKFDPNAVVVKAMGKTVGYVGRLQAKSIAARLAADCSVECCLARLNGSRDSPRLYAFLRMGPCTLRCAA
jgi:hypothetical protein